MSYILERKLGYAYWSVDGQKALNEGEGYGLLTADYNTQQQPKAVADLYALARYTVGKELN